MTSSLQLNVDTLGDEIFFVVKKELDARKVKYKAKEIQNFCFEAAECIVDSLQENSL